MSIGQSRACHGSYCRSSQICKNSGLIDYVKTEKHWTVILLICSFSFLRRISLHMDIITFVIILRMVQVALITSFLSPTIIRTNGMCGNPPLFRRIPNVISPGGMVFLLESACPTPTASPKLGDRVHPTPRTCAVIWPLIEKPLTDTDKINLVIPAAPEGNFWTLCLGSVRSNHFKKRFKPLLGED
ncbi:hypothetical protein H8957_010241 [Semnopithecus entellus]|uniref:uncharacterized protein LOC117088657 n=1 Tax=Trachypithecus francoisi TaxID=54180 RepID=UPI00141AEF54|nr:uncharacterized protein LOC117088657 [Trachypithecus francoisi]